ncbi:hypothetical protein [Rhodococcus globerulus]|uniref:hypothetical protein n=1 Tax=Rhodococcus globerulus TaxID=33008 RepID=UPI000AD6F05B|nr:hypothetical protein [Rhodococcus globerulus]
MWWIVVGGLILWVACAVPIAIILGKVIAKRDSYDFEGHDQVWVDGVIQSMEKETDSETETEK